MRTLLLLWIGMLPVSLSAQQTWTVHLLNPADSAVVPFAQLQWYPEGAGAFSDLEGYATLPMPEPSGEAQLLIKAIGYDSLWQVTPVAGRTDTLWIAQGSTEIDEVQIEGLTAREVVRRAMAAVPHTFADSSYAAYGFYRTYDEINGQYANLIELQGVLLMLLQKDKNEVQAKEMLGVQSLRRSPRWDPVPNPDEQDFMEMIWHNPIYHQRLSSLTPSWNPYTQFSFDTITDTHYKVYYRLPRHSSDNHGITSREENPFEGEADEEGWLTIEREGLGIQSYERKTTRNSGFVYRMNNFVLPDKRFRAELVDGYFRCDFIKLNGRWYPNRVLRSYTNDYRAVFPEVQTYRIQSAFELHIQYVSHKRPQDPNLVFDFQPKLRTMDSPAATFPETLPPVHFGEEKRLYEEVGEWE